MVETGTTETNQRWICGWVPLNREESVYIDSRTGKGVDQVCKRLEKFFWRKNKTISFPYSSPEDLLHDIYVLALQALPNYNPNKNASILTFLQGHVTRRLVNKFKFVAQAKRRASLTNISYCKAKCSECSRFTVFPEKQKKFTCEHCGSTEPYHVKYNLPLPAIGFGVLDARLEREEHGSSFAELVSDANRLAHLLGEPYYDLEKEIQLRLDFGKLYESMSDLERQVIDLLVQGFDSGEIASRLKKPENWVTTTTAKIMQNYRL